MQDEWNYSRSATCCRAKTGRFARVEGSLSDRCLVVHGLPDWDVVDGDCTADT